MISFCVEIIAEKFPFNCLEVFENLTNPQKCLSGVSFVFLQKEVCKVLYAINNFFNDSLKCPLYCALFWLLTKWNLLIFLQHDRAGSWRSLNSQRIICEPFSSFYKTQNYKFHSKKKLFTVTSKHENFSSKSCVRACRKFIHSTVACLSFISCPQSFWCVSSKILYYFILQLLLPFYFVMSSCDDS